MNKLRCRNKATSLGGISKARLVQLATLLALVVTCTTSLAISSALAAPLQPRMPFSVAPLGQGDAQAETGPQSPIPIPSSYIVVFKDSVEHPANLADAQTEAPGRDLGLVYRHALKGYSAELPTTAVEALRENPQIKYVVPDHKVKVFAQTVPTGIERTYDTQNETAAIDGVDTRVNADVAVIDTGIDYTQPDLNVYKRADCVPASQGAPVECIEGAGTDGFGHGTHVAGTIGAIDNGSGVVGVAPGVRLWAVRALNSQGGGQESWILAAMDWVTAHASEIEVANMSLGGGYGEGKDPLTEALETSVNAGVVYVVAAGNEAEDVKYVTPARAPGAITIGALADYDGKPGAKSDTTCRHEVGADDTMATFSNYGEGVDLVAPGVCIYSTLPMGGSVFGKEYGYLSGTSMAAPHVAGAAALLASKSNPNSRADIESIRNQLVEAGSLNYSDTTPEPPSPLLYLGKDQLEPEVITGGISSLTAFSATLTGGVAPKGIATEYKFEYGPTAAYGTVKPVPSGVIKAGAGYTRVSQAVSGLESGVRYHFRLVASNNEGTRTGKDETFTPYIDTVTTVATELGETKATLNGVQYLGDWPKGEPTEYKFEYGQTKAYGSKVSAAEVREFEDCSYECSEEQEVFGSQWAHALKPLTGLAKETKYHYRMVASNSLGTFTAGDQAFRTELWPKWTVSGEYKGDLGRISCSAVNVCMGIGGIHESEAWNGTTAKTATYALNYPQGNNESLLDVSCVSATNCTAVGREGACVYGTECTKALLPMIMQWNGEKWTKQSVPALPGGSESGYLKAVECTSATWCIAVGQYTKVESGKSKFEYASMLWNGENWTFQALPKASYVEAPFSAPDITLNDVSCTSTSNCTAVGYETMHWDGSSWSRMAMPFPDVTLTSVSCSSSSACMAVGYRAYGEENDEEAAARRWDGKQWSVVHMGALVKPGGEARPENVSCAAAWSCVAVGWGPIGGRHESSFVTRWDGKEWAVEASESGGRLQGVDCESTSHCTLGGGFGTIDTSDFTVSVPKPTATTEAATAISQTEATPRAAVNTNNQPTSYFFEYGTTTGYGAKSPVPSAEAGFSQSATPVSQVISGLVANTTYHYRVVAQSEAGTAQGGDMTFTTLPSCKGGGGKCEWKSQTTPDLTTSTYNLSGVSCPSSTMCLAAGTDKLKGKPLAELWNGSAWSNLTWGSPAAPGATDVACSSTTTCMVVGGTEIGASEERLTAWSFKEEGGNWLKPPKTLPVPSGASRLILRSVSCSSSTACTAVGSYYLASEKVFKPLVERWDGTNWALQTAPIPVAGGSEKAMMSVSCASATSCVTVGTVTVGSTNTLTVAESWNGTSWSLMSAPSPGTLENALEDISCNSSSACIATGLYKESGTGQRKKPLAERWNGTAWSVLSVPIPAGAEGDVTLKGISCATTSYCSAVGKYTPGKEVNSEFKTLAEYWDGAKWTVQASPNSSLKGNALTAVSCSSTIACTAVGNAQIIPGEPFGEASLAERWNGTEWKSQTTPDLTTSTYNLSGVSCASSTMCLAAGTDKLKGKPLAELWNGSAWSNLTWGSPAAPGATDVACSSTTTCMVVGGTEIGASEERLTAWSFKEEGGNWLKPPKTLPVPSGASRLILRSVSCSSSTACTAVGSYYLAGEKLFKPLVERWDGTSWALQTAPNPPSGGSEKAMMSVSCASATSCITVGTTGTLTVAESWNGTSWSLMTTLSPGTKESTLEDISCNSSSACIATGLYKETGTVQFKKPLAERWNGTEWSVLSVPSPAGAEGDVTLKGVSCATTSHCTAVGKYSPVKTANIETKTLAEYWDGAKWTVQASPNSSLKGNALTAVSCSSAIACTAVGNAQTTPGEPFGEVSLAQRYE